MNVLMHCRMIAASTPRRPIFVVLALLGASVSHAASPSQGQVRNWRERNQQPILQEFFGLVEIPNYAADKANIVRNAEYIATMMNKRGIAPRLLTSRISQSNPAVFGEVK